MWVTQEVRKVGRRGGGQCVVGMCVVTKEEKILEEEGANHGICAKAEGRVDTK